MTREETKNLFAYIGTLYPLFTKDTTSEKIDLWTELLCDFTYEEIVLSFREYARTNLTGFPPMPANLIKPIVEKRMSDQAVDEGKAWAMVREAIGNSGYDSVREFKKLPPVIQRAVGDPYVLFTWSQMDSENMTVIQSQFLRAYRTAYSQAVSEVATTGRMPEKVKLIEQSAPIAIEEHHERSAEEKAELYAWLEEQKAEERKGRQEREPEENYDYLLKIKEEHDGT